MIEGAGKFYPQRTGHIHDFKLPNLLHLEPTYSTHRNIFQYSRPDTKLTLVNSLGLTPNSRIGIKNFIKPAATVNVNRPVKQVIAFAGSYRWLWVTDDNQRLIGWVDKSTLSQSASIKEAMDEGVAGEIALSDSATLREALSRMLGLGFKYIPVIDDGQKLVGEVVLGDIEAATSEEENRQ